MVSVARKYYAFYWYNIIVLLWCIHRAAATDEKEMSSETTDSIPALVHYFFGTCVSLVSTVFAYAVVTEYRLMKHYESKGRCVEGRIIDWRYSRRLFNENDDEYDVAVDYRYLEVGGYTTVIRKQLKCRRSELYISDDSQHEFVKVCVEVDNVFSFEEALFDRPNHRRIQLLLLDDYPNSGIPKSTVRDASRAQRKTTTLAFFILLLLLATFCYFLGLATIFPSFSLLKLIAISIAATALLCSLEAFVLWGLCRWRRWDSVLTAEYLEGGEVLVKVDSETLGTLSTSESMSSR